MCGCKQICRSTSRETQRLQQEAVVAMLARQADRFVGVYLDAWADLASQPGPGEGAVRAGAVLEAAVGQRQPQRVARGVGGLGDLVAMERAPRSAAPMRSPAPGGCSSNTSNASATAASAVSVSSRCMLIVATDSASRARSRSGSTLVRRRVLRHERAAFWPSRARPVNAARLGIDLPEMAQHPGPATQQLAQHYLGRVGAEVLGGSETKLVEAERLAGRVVGGGALGGEQGVAARRQASTSAACA